MSPNNEEILIFNYNQILPYYIVNCDEVSGDFLYEEDE